MQALTSHIITVLADGQFHTGTALGARFKVSKTSVWKAINTLDSYGLDVHCVRGKGYRLCEPLTLLQETLIRQGLPDYVNRRTTALAVHTEIDSTNTWLLEQLQSGQVPPEPEQLHVCLSEMQLNGKGRRGRQWVSPFGQNIYMSVLKSFDTGAAGLNGLSLVAGIAIIRALRHWPISQLGLKWPNDIYCNGSKVGGVLLEISGDLQSRCQVVIGLGLNVVARAEVMKDITQPWTDLARNGFNPVRRNQLVARLLEALVETLDQFQRAGFSSFREEWAALDLSYGQPVQITGSGAPEEGVGAGIDDSGAFVLQSANGIKRFHGGEVSLRIQADAVAKDKL